MCNINPSARRRVFYKFKHRALVGSTGCPLQRPRLLLRACLLLFEPAARLLQVVSSSRSIKILNWTSPVLAVGCPTVSPTAISGVRTCVVFQHRQVQVHQPPAAAFQCQQTQRSPLVIARQPLVQATPQTTALILSQFGFGGDINLIGLSIMGGEELFQVRRSSTQRLFCVADSRQYSSTGSSFNLSSKKTAHT